MYICICKGITDKEIRTAVHNGASSFRKVRNSLGVSSQCGQCACDAKAVINEALSEIPQNTDSPLFYAIG